TYDVSRYAALSSYISIASAARAAPAGRGGGAGAGSAAWEHVRVRTLRTPDDRFADLPGFPWAPRYADVGGLRMAYVADGPPDRAPVLLLHREASCTVLHR